MYKELIIRVGRVVRSVQGVYAQICVFALCAALLATFALATLSKADKAGDRFDAIPLRSVLFAADADILVPGDPNALIGLDEVPVPDANSQGPPRRLAPPATAVAFTEIDSPETEQADDLSERAAGVSAFAGSSALTAIDEDSLSADDAADAADAPPPALVAIDDAAAVDAAPDEVASEAAPEAAREATSEALPESLPESPVEAASPVPDVPADTATALAAGPPPSENDSVYASMSSLDEVRRQESVADGDPRQLAQALTRTPIDTTIPQTRLNDLIYDPPDLDGATLPLRDVVIYTLKNNPDIGIARWQAEDSRYAVRGARAPLLPSVDVNGATGLENIYVEESGGSFGLNRREASVRVTQRLFDFGRTSQTLKRAKALYQSTELAFRDTVEDTVFQAIVAYLDLLATSQLLDNAWRNVEEHEAIFDLVRISYEGGNTSEAELKRARTRLDRARTTAIDFENRREGAVGNFRNITGLEPGVLIDPSVDISRAAFLSEETVDDIVAQTFAVQATLRDTNSIKHQISAARKAYLPEFRLEVTGRYQDNFIGNEAYTTEGRAMVAATWNLYDGGVARSRANQLRARERENQQRLVKQRNELKQEAINILSVLRTTEDKRAIFTEQVETAERVIDLYAKQFEAGRRTLLELLDAQAELAEAREESIANKYENLSAAFASMRFQNNLTTTLAEELNFSPNIDG